MSFEETLKRYLTFAKSNEFGEDDMNEWLKEHDYLNEIKETLRTSDQTKEQILSMILNDIGEK